MTALKLPSMIELLISSLVLVSCQGPDTSELISSDIRAKLADLLGVDRSQIVLDRVEIRDWPDDCLGAAEPGEACAQVITPGYEVTLVADGNRYDFRSNQDGTLVKLISPLAGSLPVVAESPPEVATAPTPPGARAETVVIGGDEQALRNFISRWFASLYPSAPEGGASIRIGSLPDDLPFDLPLPAGAAVVASISEPLLELQVILDVPQTSAEIKTFYEQALADAGWRKISAQNQGGGFVVAYDYGDTYCFTDDQAALMIQTLDAAQGTDLRLNLYTRDTSYMCNPGTQGMDQSMGMMPVLEMPAEAMMTGSSSGGSSNGTADISADIQTQLSAIELQEYITEQLPTQNWRMVSQGSADSFAWSTWETSDAQEQNWMGTFLVFEFPTVEDYLYATMRIVKIP